jgi:hypothetical protein
VAGLAAVVIVTNRSLAARAEDRPATDTPGRAASAMLAVADAERSPVRVGRADALRDVGGPDTSDEPGPSPGLVATPGGPGKMPQPEGLQQQGNVVAIFEDPTDPLIVIAVDHGYLTIRLRCGARCPPIQLGDYVVAEGHVRSEAVFDAVDVWIVNP